MNKHVLVIDKCHNKCGSKCAPSTNCQDKDFKPLGCATKKSVVLSLAEKHLATISINEYNFEKIRYRLESEDIIPNDQIDKAIDEFRKFLTVIVHSEGGIGMISPTVDEVWHAFILHTYDYTTFCRETFGFYLHHEPNTPWTPSSEDSVPNFIDGYKTLFGELDPIWMSHSHDCDYAKCDFANCANCQSKCQ